MAQQDDEGWPLGLQPLNARIGLVRNQHDHNNNYNSGSVSFNTLITASLPSSSSSSTHSSSDLDTQSTGSFFPDKSTTLGSLIGVSSILELSRRSLRGVKAEVLKSKNNIGNKSNWSSCLLCMCSRTSIDDGDGKKVEENGASLSLGHFLAVERKAANETRRNQSLLPIPMYGPDDEFVLAQTQSVDDDDESNNSLFVNGSIAPPPERITTTMPRQSFERDRESRRIWIC